MKKNYCLLVFLFSLLLISCNNKKKGTLRIILDIEPMSGYSETQLKEALHKRIISNVGSVHIRNIEIKTKQALIEIDEIPDDSELIQTIVHSLPQKGRGIQFYETYDAYEIAPLLVKFSEKYMATAFDSLTKSIDLQKPVTLEERVAHIKDSIDVEMKRSQPFGGILSFNLKLNEDNTQTFQPGSILGYCAIKDSATLFHLLDSAQKSNIFPQQLFFKTQRASHGDDIIEIHTLRLTPPKNKPAMEGDIIESATKDYDANAGGIYISLLFRPSSVETWRLLTKRAAPTDINGRGKCIAILYDDQLLCAPTVNGEIPNGNSQISGNYTNREASILTAKLNTGNIPCVIKLNNHEFVPAEQ